MARIGVDCDGVLANFLRRFFETANTIWPGRLDINYQNKEWYDLQGLTKPEINKVWRKIEETPDWWMTLSAYTENVGALAIFLHTHTKQDIWIVTSRSQSAGQTVAYQTYLWIRACGVDPVHNYLGVIPVPNADEKGKLYEIAGIEYSVDDRGESVELYEKVLNHTAVLLDRPWNQDAKVKHRVKNLTEFFDFIDTREKQS